MAGAYSQGVDQVATITIEPGLQQGEVVFSLAGQRTVVQGWQGSPATVIRWLPSLDSFVLTIPWPA